MSESDTMFNERDRRCAAVQLMLSTDPNYDNRTIANTLKMQIRTVQRLRAQLNASDDPLEVVERKPKAEDTTWKTRIKEFIEKVQAIIDETPHRCGDPLVQSGGRWQTLGVATGLGAGPQVQRNQGLASEGVLQLCTLLSLAPLLLRPEPTGLLRLVIRREHHQHDLQPDRRHPPNIHRAPASTCGKGMLPVPDPYRGSHCGWRRLHWILYSSSTT